MSEAYFAPMKLAEKMAWQQRVFADVRLTTSARVVAAALVNCHNSQSGRLDPGTEYLERNTGLSRRGVINARNELIEAGYLAKVQRRSGAEGKGNRTNAYRLLQARLPIAGAADSEVEPEQAPNEPPANSTSAMTAPLPAQGRAPDARPRSVSAPGGEVNAPEPMNKPMKEPSERAPAREEAPIAATTPILAHLRAHLERSKGPAWWKAWGQRLRIARLDATTLWLEAETPLVAQFVQQDVTALRLAARSYRPGISDVKITGPAGR